MPTTHYTNGSLYCRKRTCRLLHRSRGRVRPTTATDDLHPCSRHTDDTPDTTDTGGMQLADLTKLIQEGVCPWCPDGEDGYEGDGVGRHASSAHPDEWADYKQRRDGD